MTDAPQRNSVVQLTTAFEIFRTRLPQTPIRCPSQNLSPGQDLWRKDMTHLLLENQSAMSEKRTDHFKLSERKRVLEMVC